MSERIQRSKKDCYRYSDELAMRFQRYCKERRDIEITREEADLYLDSMARLYRSFARNDR